MPFRSIEPASGFQHQLSQPDRSLDRTGPRRIEHELFVDAGIERRRDRLQRQWFRQCRNQPAGNEGDQISARHDMQRLDIAGHDERNAPFDALGAQPVVDRLAVLATDDDGDMPRAQEGMPLSTTRWLALSRSGSRPLASCTSPVIPKSKAQFSGDGGWRTYVSPKASPFL